MDTRLDLDRSALRLAERLIQLLDEGSFTATYKYAVLIGLMDLCMEHTTATGVPPDVLTTRQLAEKVIELYWFHGLPFSDHVLRQSATGQQAEIVQRVQAFRESVGCCRSTGRGERPEGSPTRGSCRPWSGSCGDAAPQAPAHRPGGGPLPLRVQLLPRRLENQRLLQPYWEGTGETFDNRLLLKENVGASLIALNGVLRPLIHRQWAMMVARLNQLQESVLEDFLFGNERISLEPVRTRLRDLQDGRCFYCDGPLSSKYDVDHFIPWARHADNGIHNLVAADKACNNRKRDHWPPPSTWSTGAGERRCRREIWWRSPGRRAGSRGPIGP